MFSSIDDDLAEEKHDTKRKSRNLSEKKRRDQFNVLVNELSVMTSLTSRKLDKSAVLKSTIAFLKNHNEVAVLLKVHEIPEDWKPPFLSNKEFTHLVLEALDSFIIVFSSSGRILYTSEGITALLGYLPSDLLHTTIYDLTSDKQHSELYNILRNPPAFVGCNGDSVSNEDEIQFHCHLKRGELDFRDEVSYEEVRFTGYFRDNVNMDNVPISTRSGIPDELESKIVFIGTCRIARPQLIREMSIQGCIKSEFTSRHSLEWKFLYLDHRAPPIIGYLPFEVLGTSGYDYYHFDDLEQVVTCHKALKQKGEGTSCYYRFLTKGQQWLWLQTRYYITYHQWTSKPEFIMCIHRVVNYVDVVQQMRRNNGQVEDVYDLNDSADSVDRQLNTSASSMIITSPLSTRSVRSRKHLDSESSSRVTLYNKSHRQTGSEDTTNSDGPAASNDHLYVGSHQSESSRIRPYSQSVKMSPKRHSTFRSSSTYIEDSSENLNKFPIISQPNLIVTSPQDNNRQFELQRKQEELKQIIFNQQDELRRVNEQLIIAQYGVPIVSIAHSVSPHNATTTVIPNCEMHVSTYPQKNHHPHHHQQLHNPSHDHPKSSGPSMHEAMQIDRDVIQHQAYHQEHYPLHLLNISSDQQMQHSGSTKSSLELDNEPVSYMQLQSVHLSHTDSSSPSHHQRHHQLHPQYNFLNRHHHSSHYQTELAASSSGKSTQDEEKHRQDRGPYCGNRSNTTQEPRLT